MWRYWIYCKDCGYWRRGEFEGPSANVFQGWQCKKCYSFNVKGGIEKE